MGNCGKEQNEWNPVPSNTIKEAQKASFWFGGGSRTLNMQTLVKSVPRYHVATINQCFDRKNTLFLICRHSSIIFLRRGLRCAVETHGRVSLQKRRDLIGHALFHPIIDIRSVAEAADGTTVPLVVKTEICIFLIVINTKIVSSRNIVVVFCGSPECGPVIEINIIGVPHNTRRRCTKFRWIICWHLISRCTMNRTSFPIRSSG